MNLFAWKDMQNRKENKMGHKTTKFIVLSIAGMILCSCNSGNSRDQQFVQLFQRAVPAVVVIRSDRTMENNRFPDIGKGTGFFINDEYVLTVNHVVEAYRGIPIELRLWNGEAVEAEVVARDTIHDLALLRIDPNAVEHYKIPKLNLETDPQIGETVFIIGSPHMYYNTMAKGIFSRGSTLGRNSRWLWKREVYFIDVTTMKGNSGSPVFNVELGVIGIVSGTYSDITVVIPSHRIRSFLVENKGLRK